MSEHQQELSDQELIQRAIIGDQDAFGDLYERYLDDIYRYVYYRVLDVNEAEDLTEAVFLRAWGNLQKGRRKVNITNFRAWIYRIAHNLVIDHHRKKKPVSLDLDVASSMREAAMPNSETIVQQQLDSAELAAAIHKLDDTLQQVIILRFLNELSHAEAAAVLDLKEGHVRVLQYRALKQLRKHLREEKDGYF
ncbi:MAG TPA: sigma-70 family RNA polymerase sigma factor [Anaerolineales bacterium]|nr:sigma-70 family RNA polymerase sigma factor [Anaerolineales bacterium]